MMVFLICVVAVIGLGCRYLWYLIASGDAKDIEFGIGSRSINRPSVIKPPKDSRHPDG